MAIHPHPKTGLYCLHNEFCVNVGGFRVTVPAEFQFDGASIPPIFWVALYSPYHPKVVEAALIHDYLYVTHQFSKRRADLIFLDILKHKGVPKGRREAMRRGVQLFGGRAWRRRYKKGRRS